MFYMCLTHKCGFGVNSYASISKGRTQDVTAHGVNSEQLLFPVERLQTSLFFRSDQEFQPVSTEAALFTLHAGADAHSFLTAF